MNGVFEAEIVPINENTGEFLPFQELMHRRRKYKLDKASFTIPNTQLIFSMYLYYDKKDCLNLEYSERRKILEQIRFMKITFAKLVPMLFVGKMKMRLKIF